MKTYIPIILVFIVIIFTSNISATPISVPMDHWSYQFIERLQAKGVLKEYLSNTKPYTRDEVADMIFYTSNMLDEGKIRLSKIQKEQLEELKREFAQELKSRGISDINGYKHVINWSDKNKSVIVDMALRQDATIKTGDKNDRIFNTFLDFEFKGDIKDSFFFYSNIRNSYENSTEPRPIWNPYPYRYPYRSVSDSYIVLELSWFDLQFGKDAILWGPGYHGVVGLSAIDPSFSAVKLPIKIWKIKFTSIVGSLRDNIRDDKGFIIKKYISAHRFEVNPYPGICIGWQEAYVYARDISLDTLNPIMPYQIAEDYFGDIGNNTVEGDIDIYLIPNTRIYTSLFLDDYHPNSDPFKRAGFRWAILGGFLIVDPLGFENFDIRAEYARIEPWVYPHKGIVMKHPIPTSYKHFDTSLGHWIGPNADDLLFEANYYLTKDIQMTTSYNRIREGELGGSLYEYDYDILEYGEKEFLGGIVEGKHKFNIGLKYRIFQDSTIGVDYSYMKINNKQTEEAKLPNMDRYKTPIWVAGNEFSQNIIKASLRLRY